MKAIVSLLILTASACYAQDDSYNYQPSRKTPVTLDDMHGKRLYGKDFDAGYQTSIPGWIIKRGDTLELGRGTMPDKSFAFGYQNPGSMTAMYAPNGQLVKSYLSSMNARSRVIVKDLGMIGTKRTGFSMAAVVGVGTMTRYQFEIENAIEAGEIVPPRKFRKATSQAGGQPMSAADELLKYKKLLDSGAITQEEYNAQKKKLLSQ